MKSIFLISSMLISLLVGAQKQSDVQLIRDHVLSKSYDTKRVQSHGLYALYKNHFTDQIINSCIYDQSCSTFSHGALKNFGLLKGTILTADRMTRCNRITYAETNQAFINSSGEIIDHWEDYDWKK